MGYWTNKTMKIIKTILKFLSGKKGSIASIVGLIVVYLTARDILGSPEVELVMGITVILFGGASYMTGRLVYGNKK